VAAEAVGVAAEAVGEVAAVGEAGGAVGEAAAAGESVAVADGLGGFGGDEVVAVLPEQPVSDTQTIAARSIP